MKYTLRNPYKGRSGKSYTALKSYFINGAEIDVAKSSLQEIEIKQGNKDVHIENVE